MNTGPIYRAYHFISAQTNSQSIPALADSVTTLETSPRASELPLPSASASSESNEIKLVGSIQFRKRPQIVQQGRPRRFDQNAARTERGRPTIISRGELKQISAMGSGDPNAPLRAGLGAEGFCSGTSIFILFGDEELSENRYLFEMRVGKVSLLCGGRLVAAPEAGAFYAAVCLIMIPSACFWAFTCVMRFEPSLWCPAALILASNSYCLIYYTFPPCLCGEFAFSRFRCAAENFPGLGNL